MKWFDNWFAKKSMEAWNSSQQKQSEDSDKYSTNIGVLTSGRPMRGTAIRSDEGLRSQSTNFSLYNANGGTVVELRSYNETTDRNSTSLYVISSDKDLGQELGHIVTMEALKR